MKRNEKKYFNPIRVLKEREVRKYDPSRKTKHAKDPSRMFREATINRITKGERTPVAGIVVDQGRADGGNEIHIVTREGIIEIYDEFSGKLITKLIAKPSQLRRYSDKFKFLRKTLDPLYWNARIHESAGLNEI